MASAGAQRQPEAQNGEAVGLAQVAEIPEVKLGRWSGRAGEAGL